ncbi:sodium:solute symporter [Bacillus pseudomycoides]|uniref:Sodium:solute symporter n=1 Tax=Bacillus pseudomycoides TaxID=64104 RepID=A0AA91V9E3_9BACI|nr:MULTISPECIES: sodium:solute symporter [Bacillus]PEB53700.1 sodium:solute symporter [Bacillus sp. AFS098217]PED81013.1 sodium:solute symporter [Bacillus pseudomycoides]PEU10707.1 sodium:solute symporter [Bacillus sp. AFS019443]PEU19031.1 sodium:solute symporter [Bacillus sp. AFS014408]PFW61025.1 sodium:solute symporter [Bacillus sp. AFS075034]
MTALIIITLFLCFSLFLGIRAQRGKDMNLEQWSVGGRGFGTIFVFLLMAGEIYTTFTFLGGSGWAYSKGAPTFYILGYGALAYILSYFLLPPVWKYAKQHGLISQPDFFTKKYSSKVLGIIVSIIGVVSIIPYLVLQLKGLGIIVSEASYGKVSPVLAVWIGAITITIYVMISGIHGSAWTAALKDIMILFIVMFLGIYLPYHYYGGLQPMFEAVEAAKPGFLALPEEGMSISWFVSTIILTALGFYMWPHTFASAFSAKSAKVFRKNAAIMPLYSLVLLFVFFAGFAAILQVPGLKGADADLSLFRLAIQTFDPWFIGIIGSAGLLTALVPGSMLVMAASTLLAKNIYQVLAPSVSDQQVARAAKLFVPVVTLVAVFFTFKGGETIGALLLMGYSIVTQLFPALVCSLFHRQFITKQGAIAGMVVGLFIVAYITLSGSTLASMFPSFPQYIKDLNVGIVALGVNSIVMLVVSMVTKNIEVKHNSTVVEK